MYIRHNVGASFIIGVRMLTVLWAQQWSSMIIGTLAFDGWVITSCSETPSPPQCRVVNFLEIYY